MLDIFSHVTSRYQRSCPAVRFIRRLAGLLVLASALLAVGTPARAATVVVIEARTTIGVASTLALDAGLARARRENAALVVLALDTPGGLVSSTREMIRTILASPIPVAVYVSPSGARAASAGTYLAYAAHVAAMAPGTSIGAATPVQLGGGDSRDRDADEPTSKDDGKADRKRGGGGAMERKVLNDSIAYLRGLAQLRGRNADFAERAVRDAATLTADEAVRDHVVDLVAADVPDLLAKLDGRSVTVNGREVTLATRDASIIEIVPNWRMQLLALLTDPNVAFLLLLAGVYGLVIEAVTPGVIAPGVLGAIALLLGLGALTMLPVNIVGVALLALGVVLLLIEAFVPGFGVIGLGGLVAFVAGGLYLFDPEGADIDFRVALPVLAGAAAASAILLAGLIGVAVRSRRRRVATGDPQMRDHAAEVVTWTGLAGTVRVRGEIWSARSLTPHAPGESVRIVERDGLTLVVR